MRISLPTIYFIGITLFFLSCSKDSTEDEYTLDSDNSAVDCNLGEISASSDVIGFGILDRLPGIWNGPVTSPTPLGSYPEWIVDFRPNHEAQISAKNELDSINDIFMSFFIVKHDCKYQIGFRNGGGFAGQQRNSYMIIDSLQESMNEAFYRFIDPAGGEKRVTTDVKFKDDSLIMHVYTNDYNTLTEPITHMVWKADLRDQTAAQSAVNNFNFPQKKLVKDFSTTFDGLEDAVFYSPNDDPYPESEQPHLGQSQVNINISNPTTVDTNKKVLIIVTTEPLFNGVQFQVASLDFRSRYVFIDAGSGSTGFNFNYMHPGNYYVNAIYDEDGSNNFSSGDYINGSFDQSFTLDPEGQATVPVTINFEIP